MRAKPETPQGVLTKNQISMSTETTETPVKKNLFAGAKKQPATAKKASDKKQLILSETAHPGISVKMERLVDLRGYLSEYETEAAQLEEEIKGIGNKVFIEEYKNQKRRPDSFTIRGENGGEFLLLVIDKYASVPDDTRAAELRKQFGEDVVTTTKAYGFNAALLEKYMDQISEALSECDAIPEEIKGDLIEVVEKHAITKGSIERMMQFEGEKQDMFMFNIKPQIQLKVVVAKG